MSAIQHILPDELVINKIYHFRGIKVMLDSDLAELYGVETRRLKEQVRRNIDRFPEDFMFELTTEEFNSLIISKRSQNATSNWKSASYTPFVFTEQGVAMLSSVLNSKQAIFVNIQIIRVFTKMRELLTSHKEILFKLDQLEKKDIEHDDKILLILDYIKQLEQTKQDDIDFSTRKKIGFKN